MRIINVPFNLCHWKDLHHENGIETGWKYMSTNEIYTKIQWSIFHKYIAFVSGHLMAKFHTGKLPNLAAKTFGEFYKNDGRQLPFCNQIRTCLTINLGVKYIIFSYFFMRTFWCSICSIQVLIKTTRSWKIFFLVENWQNYSRGCTSWGPHIFTYGFHQLVSEPTHLLPTSTYCIDLIFTDQPNLVVDSGTHSTLNPKCHHQITYCKLNLNIKYPPPYQRLVWDYKRANVESIKMSIELVNSETLFHSKTVHKQVSIFNETLMNIFSNFIPNKYITFNDRDPPWMNDFVKSKIKFKNQLYNTYIKMVIRTMIIICFMKQ